MKNDAVREALECNCHKGKPRLNGHYWNPSCPVHKGAPPGEGDPPYLDEPDGGWKLVAGTIKARLEAALAEKDARIEELEAGIQDVTREAVDHIEHVRGVNENIQGPQVAALIEAAVARYEERRALLQARDEIDLVAEPFLPTPKPTRLELLEEEHRAWEEYHHAINRTTAHGEFANIQNAAWAAHRAVEEAGEGE